MVGQLSDTWRTSAARAAVRPILRRSFLRLGQRLQPTALADLRVVLGYLELGAWFGTPIVYPDKAALFAAAPTFDAQRPLYLEFGVYRGASMAIWSRTLSQPAARLVGFDSFEGLTTDWRPGFEAGTFKAGGPPHVIDPRVSFEVGLFDQTLPGFELPDHDQLIVNIDCDLYESTNVVLRWAEPYLRPGTLIYFDELPDRDHELRALREHLDRTSHRLEALGIAGGGLHWLFRYTA